MKLFFRELGTGPPLIIAHGLYGSSDNWVSIGKALASSFHVYLLDLRNHGQSPHSAIHNYQEMAADILEFMDDQHIERASLLGHSMGGKVMMTLTLNHPERISQLIVADIAPKDYSSLKNFGKETSDHQAILESMENLDLSKATTRKDLDQQLAINLSNPALRAFLLKNIKKTPYGFSWKLNLPVLKKSLGDILAMPSNKPIHSSSFPVLFIKGEKSPYIQEEDSHTIRQFFPFSEIATLPGTGHWLHAEAPEKFIEIIRFFAG